jgi:hypothetical protein
VLPFFGNSLALRLPFAPPGDGDCLPLGSYRAAQRVLVRLGAPRGGGGGDGEASTSGGGGGGSSDGGAPPKRARRSAGGGGAEAGPSGAAPPPASPPSASGGGGSGGLALWVVNTHLDHASAATRAAQAAAICDWMAAAPGGAAGVVIMGDLNAPEGEPAHGVLAARGYASAHRAAHGAEPKATWPSGLVAPLADRGDPHCADYVYFAAAAGYRIAVIAAGLAGDAPSPADATLYASDHLALRVALRVSRAAG